jgi:hypothetical protein
MKFATTFAAVMIAGLPLGAALEPASAKVFDWSLTGPSPDLGGVPFPGSATIDASPTGSTGVWSIDTITGIVNGSDITGTSTFEGADNFAVHQRLCVCQPKRHLLCDRRWTKREYHYL